MTCLELACTSVVAAILLVPTWAPSQDTGPKEAPSDPLAPFERLVGGQWHLDGSYQEFEWGLGRRSIKSRSYFRIEGKPKLVSKGTWFWHPGESQIKGVFTATDMPVAFFDYTTRFEGNIMLSELRSYGTTGIETRYVETREFGDDTHFVWKLLKDTSEGLQEEMGGIYSRR